MWAWRNPFLGQNFSNGGVGGGISLQLSFHISLRERYCRSSISRAADPGRLVALPHRELTKLTEGYVLKEKLKYHKYKVSKVPPQNGRPLTTLSPVMEAPCQCTLSQLWSLAIHPSEIPYRYTLPTKALIDVPFGQKR